MRSADLIVVLMLLTIGAARWRPGETRSRTSLSGYEIAALIALVAALVAYTVTAVADRDGVDIAFGAVTLALVLVGIPFEVSRRRRTQRGEIDPS